MESKKLIFTNNLYNDVICDFNTIYKAYQKAHRGKSLDAKVIEFDKHKLYNLKRIQSLLKNKEWDKIFKYYRFTVTRPKERVIDAMQFEGRIVQHILCDNILEPWFECRVIYTNSACRKNKGTDFALDKTKQNLVKYLRHHNDGYILKMDIKKYFPSIDRTVLKRELNNFPNLEIKELLFYIIDSAPIDIGIPIGNQTSQWFALYYLNKVDRIIKEQFKMKYYVRYMDDFYCISDNKYKLVLLLNYLKKYLKIYLNVSFNGKTQIIPLHKGLVFLGWRFLYEKDTHKIIMRLERAKLNDRKKTLRINYKLISSNQIEANEYKKRCHCMKVNLEKGNTYFLRKKLEKKYKWLYNISI